ncbi:MAG TPA: hypothetical protein VGZ28_14775 [Terriglobales bacterium]|jgi:hypothetical protein|nr:hypothetical protein [Terriglobales bacterium]
MPDFPISWVRLSFPALNNADDFVFFDNGAGAQVRRPGLGDWATTACPTAPSAFRLWA